MKNTILWGIIIYLILRGRRLTLDLSRVVAAFRDSLCPLVRDSLLEFSVILFVFGLACATDRLFLRGIHFRCVHAHPGPGLHLFPYI